MPQGNTAPHPALSPPCHRTRAITSSCGPLMGAVGLLVYFCLHLSSLEQPCWPATQRAKHDARGLQVFVMACEQQQRAGLPAGRARSKLQGTRGATLHNQGRWKGRRFNITCRPAGHLSCIGALFEPTGRCTAPIPAEALALSPASGCAPPATFYAPACPAATRLQRSHTATCARHWPHAAPWAARAHAPSLAASAVYLHWHCEHAVTSWPRRRQPHDQHSSAVAVPALSASSSSACCICAPFASHTMSFALQ